MTRLDDLESLEPSDRDELRAWLEVNHHSSPGVWLAVGKKGGRLTNLRYDDAVEEALAFGWIDSTTRALDDDRFRILFTPRKAKSTWARSNKERVKRLTDAGLMAEAGLAAVATAKANGSWSQLDDIDALIVPTNLTAALSADIEAEKHFGAMSDSAKRQVLYWIASAKRAETRERRITRTVAALREGKSPVG